MNLLIAFIVAMGITMALIPPLMRAAGALHVLDAPGGRKQHAGPIPRVGGIAMAAGAFVPLLIWMPFDARTLACLAAAGLVLAFGIWDDRATLSPTAKFIGQLLAVFVVVFGADVRIGTLSLADRVALPEFLSIPLTVFFLLGATNAINLSDGLDGLAGGTTLLCLAMIAALALPSGLDPVMTLAIVVCGSILGFLRYNTYPARVFMGDGGSQFLGFTVAVLAVQLTQNVAAPLSAALPLLLLGLPIVDTLMVMSQRLREGRSPFAADNKHIHHKLLGLGFDHHEAVVVIYAIQSTFFLAAWFMRYESDGAIVAVFAALAFSLLGALIGAGRLGWRWRQGAAVPAATGMPVQASTLRRAVGWLAQPAHLPRWALRCAGACAIAYLAAVGVLADVPTRDVAWLAAAIALLLATALLAGRLAREPGTGPVEWMSRVALYVAATLGVYLDHVDASKPAALQIVKFSVLPLLALCLVMRVRLSGDRRFRFTPLDALLIFVAISVPNLPGLAGASSNLGLSVAKLVVLVYAIELFVDQSSRAARALSAGAVLFAVIVAGRGMF
jgi:UDP-GlcNAc:undecaprenyl-phosphate GlcNAc-1-phosphate transferase